VLGRWYEHYYLHSQWQCYYDSQSKEAFHRQGSNNKVEVFEYTTRTPAAGHTFIASHQTRTDVSGFPVTPLNHHDQTITINTQ
jgi:hypothetical protein